MRYQGSLLKSGPIQSQICSSLQDCLVSPLGHILEQNTMQVSANRLRPHTNLHQIRPCQKQFTSTTCYRTFCCSSSTSKGELRAFIGGRRNAQLATKVLRADTRPRGYEITRATSLRPTRHPPNGYLVGTRDAAISAATLPFDALGSSIPQAKTVNQLQNALAQKTRLSDALKSAPTAEAHALRPPTLHSPT